jgi:hypothetical protein
MSKQVKVFLILITILGLSGCAGTTSSVTPAAQPITSAPSVTETPFQSPTEEPTASPTALYVSANANLWVEIDSPADGAVVNVPQLEVTGKAAVGTTLTINDNILYLENGEHFSDILTLVEGENLVEVIGSDADGNEVSLYITVYYEP